MNKLYAEVLLNRAFLLTTMMLLTENELVGALLLLGVMSSLWKSYDAWMGDAE